LTDQRLGRYALAEFIGTSLLLAAIIGSSPRARSTEG